MGRSKSSSRWLKEHFDDEYVKRAKKEGFRSRAIYKLMEIQEKYRLIKPGMSVVDLGAAPGGWSQYAVKITGSKGMFIASDILPMDGLADVEFIQGDFTEQETLDQILGKLGESKANLVISDLAPNISGLASVDQPRAMYLAELSLDLVGKILVSKGCFISKLFQGTGFDEFIALLRPNFDKLRFFKPKASRPRSREVYIIATGFRGSSV
ncbi:23S rRNA (uridine(2552)-2'-O)-methyltransferase [hydrothermal vent metagenome]|uniref:23S rRNA (Uridine(2552)-2'-O)-methyltransferase n=1 Tax=hydrothermal vent metagenome TaxID=652676 RepID=A0A3B0ZMY5_9ZZZZ